MYHQNEMDHMRITKLHYLFFSIFLICNVLNALPLHDLTFFLDWYPDNTSVNKQFTAPAGIIVTYYGNKAISDSNGQVTFPLYDPVTDVAKGKKQIFYLMITNDVEPSMLLHATVDRFIVTENASYSLYAIEKIYDEETKNYLWHIQEARLQNTTIPLKTIIIHAAPEEIFVRIGYYQTNNNPQIELPVILVKNNVNKAKNSLIFLQHNKFFAPINKASALTATASLDTKATKTSE